MTSAPFDAEALIAFLAARAVPGVEHVAEGCYWRSLGLPHGHGVALVTASAGNVGLDVELMLEDERDLQDADVRLRRLFDLDADPAAVDALLGADALLAPLVAAAPGLRVPGSVDPFETAVRAVIGQQISITGARTVAGRIVAACGEPLRVRGTPLTAIFPPPRAVAGAADSAFSMPGSRRTTIKAIAAALRDDELTFDGTTPRCELRGQLMLIPGIGPWTADYIAMRGLADRDVFLPTDLGVRKALAALGAIDVDPDRWRPWRSYALHHLWNALAAGLSASNVPAVPAGDGCGPPPA